MENPRTTSLSNQLWLLPYLFIFSRFIFYLGMVSSGLNGFGDVPRYYEVAALKGFPYFSYWMEYPPIFAFINTTIYNFVDRLPILYDAILYFLFTLAGAAALFIFQKLDEKLFSESTDHLLRSWIYMVLLLALPYSWWYFEMIPVALMLLGILFTLEDKPLGAGISIGLGVLTKWFPGLILPTLWRVKSRKTAIVVSSLALGLTILIYALIWGSVSPDDPGFAPFPTQP